MIYEIILFLAAVSLSQGEHDYATSSQNVKIHHGAHEKLITYYDDHDHSHHHDVHAYPKYLYTYSVDDSHTGDMKSIKEYRDGDAVKGSYSFREADGSIRTVKYTADDKHGFVAKVHFERPHKYHH